MLFSSMTFLFMFLPIVCTVYFFVRKELKNYVLLIASILFYAWGEPRYLAIMLSTILLNYVGAILISKFNRCQKLFLILTVLLNLSILFYFKYFNFVINNINELFHMNINVIHVVMPIGISFYTFQAISYLVDVYREEVAVQKNIYKLALYISLFPQLIAGPIVKYHDVANQIDDREIKFDDVLYGVKRFIIGLAKKMLIANTMGAVADKIFGLPTTHFNASIAWVGALAYSFQIFYDFSGYSDMAIGLGSLFGFKFLENFNYPYISKSITEFWRRWHISLSTWFKEYLYIPLGGNRVSKKRMYVNLLIVFLATGIWHGAEWTFVLWGIWHGLFILIERITNWHKKTGGKLVSCAQHCYTLLVVIVGWVLFRADNISHAYQYLQNMFGLLPNAKNRAPFISYYFDVFEVAIFIIGCVCSLPFFNQMLKPAQNHKYKDFCVNVWLLILLFLSSITIAASTYNPFIYFRF